MWSLTGVRGYCTSRSLWPCPIYIVVVLFNIFTHFIVSTLVTTTMQQMLWLLSAVYKQVEVVIRTFMLFDVNR